MAAASTTEAMLEELAGLKRGILPVVASQTIAAYWLPPILAIFRERYPALDVDLAIGNTEQAAARVHDGAADLGIVEGQLNNPALAQLPIGKDRLGSAGRYARRAVLSAIAVCAWRVPATAALQLAQSRGQMASPERMAEGRICSSPLE